MEKKPNSPEYEQLNVDLQTRVDLLRGTGKWNEKKDALEIKACLVAQKLAYVEGEDFGEYWMTYKNRPTITASINENPEIFHEVFGKDAKIEDLREHQVAFINYMGEAIRNSNYDEMWSKYAFSDSRRKNFPQEFVDECDKEATLREYDKKNKKDSGLPKLNKEMAHTR